MSTPFPPTGSSHVPSSVRALTPSTQFTALVMIVNLLLLAVLAFFIL